MATVELRTGDEVSLDSFLEVAHRVCDAVRSCPDALVALAANAATYQSERLLSAAERSGLRQIGFFRNGIDLLPEEFKMVVRAMEIRENGNTLSFVLPVESDSKFRLLAEEIFPKPAMA